MAQLTIKLNNQMIKRVKLESTVYLIGRSHECDIQLPERTVSSQHARLVHAGDDCFLEDLGSTNGVYVNGYACQKHLLIDNDAILIGKYEIAFNSTVSLLTQLRQLSVHPNNLRSRDLEVAQLEIVRGRKQGHIIPLQRDCTTLGGHDSNQVSLERNFEGEYLLHTTADKKATPSRRLSDGDTFTVGEFELKFREALENATV